jgi:integrase
VRKKTTFEDLAKKYEEIKKGENYFEKTRKYYIPLFKEKFGEQKLYQITPLDIEAFKKERKETPVKGGKERSDIAVNREIETLRHMLTKAVEWGMLAHSPFERFKASIFFKEDDHRIRYLTEDEIKRLFALLDEEKPKSKKNPEIKIKRYEYLGNIVRAALLTGLRKGDILSLKWADVDLDNGILFFNEQKKMKRHQAKILNGDMRQLLILI